MFAMFSKLLRAQIAAGILMMMLHTYIYIRIILCDLAVFSLYSVKKREKAGKRKREETKERERNETERMKRKKEREMRQRG